MSLNHRGYGAYISHNGKEVDVHKAKVERDKVTMSGYIVSDAGMEFKVHWVESKPSSHLSVEIRMDGRRMGVVSHVKGSSKTSNGGFRVAVDALAPFQFAPLATHDDDDLPSAYSDELGTIEIKLRRVRDFMRVEFTPRTPQPNGSVHERKTRGRGTGSHCVSLMEYGSLGDKRDVKAKSTILKPILIDDKPYVIFRFYYRPREFLESKGIIRGRSPSRSSSATAVGSAKSSSGHRKKRRRAPSEAPLSPESGSSPPPKRQRTVSEQEEGVSTSMAATDEDAQTSMVLNEDEEDSKENVVEIRLSSRDNYAIPGESASCVQVKTESPKGAKDSSPRIKRESSPEPSKGQSKRVKREPSLPPAREASQPIKREPSPLPSLLPPLPTRRMPPPAPIVKTEQSFSPQRLRAPSVKREPLSPPRRVPSPQVNKEPPLSGLKRTPRDVKREPSDHDAFALAPQPPEEDVQQELQAPKEEEETWDEEEETLVEIHVSSRNQHLVFGRPPAKAGSDGIKKIKREPE